MNSHTVNNFLILKLILYILIKEATIYKYENQYKLYPPFMPTEFHKIGVNIKKNPKKIISKRYSRLDNTCNTLL